MEPPIVPIGLVADAREDRIEQVVEAMIFAADVPLRPEDIQRVYIEVTGRDLTEEAVVGAVERLNAAWTGQGRAVRIEHWGGGYQMATIDEVAPFLMRLFSRDRETRLTRALLETLAVIAYKQPVTRPEIDHVRGVSSDYAVRSLLERGFIDITGRADSIGRPLLYGTTERFLDQFGLGTLDELPQPREIEEILADPRLKGERSRLLAEWTASLGVPDEAAESSPSEGDGAPAEVVSSVGEPPDPTPPSDG